MRAKLLCVGMALLLIGARAARAGDRSGDFSKTLQPLVQRYCFECHGDGESSGDLKLDSFKSPADMIAAQKTWDKVVKYVRSHTMPPPEADKHPSADERDELVSAVQRIVYKVDPDHPDPGRAPLRRLNRIEYRNTIRDLIGVNFDPTIDFPEDDTGYGFDNIADVLTLPTMLMEKYLLAAEKVLNDAIPPQRLETVERSIGASEATANFKIDEHVRDGWVGLSSTSEDALVAPNASAAPAEYLLRVLAYAKYPQAPPAGKTEHPPMVLSLMLGEAVVRDVEVAADEANPQWYETRVGVPAGKQLFRIAVRRIRGLAADRQVSNGRIGAEQPGQVYVKEMLIQGPATGAVRRVPADRMQLVGGAGKVGEDPTAAALFRTDDQVAAEFDVPATGPYLLRTLACADYAGNEPAKIELLLDDKPLRTFDVDAPAQWKSAGAAKGLSPGALRAVPRIYELKSDLKPGKHKLSARYINNLRDPGNADPNYRDRNVYVHYFEVVELSAPPGPPPMSEPMRRLFARHGKTPSTDAARVLLAEFTRRAWRRPPEPGELDRLMKLYVLASDNGEDFRGAVKHAMKAVLVSPAFLFRGNLPTVQREPTTQPLHLISEYELASRLSYFLWSTTPDEELLSLADRNELRANLAAQVNRMLKSPRSEALVENFAGQWLGFRNLDAAHPDNEKFEPWGERLRDAMKKETTLFFGSIVQNDSSLRDVLTGDYTFINERLAKHYGIDNVKGDNFQRVSLAGTARSGILTQGSILTLTSNPTRTSPVKRGKWVLESLLATPPLPPPPDVPPLKGDGKKVTGTLRQRMEKHRADPMCASCHAPMDPIGFGLENFDAIGRWREKDEEQPIDAKSEFPDGSKFTGPRELAQLLAKTRRNDLYRSAAEAALTFALGRGVEPTDQPAVDHIVADLRDGDGRFSKLIYGVVNSVPFQYQRDRTDVQQARAEVLP